MKLNPSTPHLSPKYSDGSLQFPEVVIFLVVSVGHPAVDIVKDTGQPLQLSTHFPEGGRGKNYVTDEQQSITIIILTQNKFTTTPLEIQNVASRFYGTQW